jgi:hypothetical protein
MHPMVMRSTESMPASSRAASADSTQIVRRLFSQSSPKGHADLAAELGVGAVVHVDLVLVELRPGPRRPVADQLDAVGDLEDEGVRAGARPERGE